MARILGVDIPKEKRLDIALTYIYGVGRSNVRAVLAEARIDGSKRVHALTDEDINKIGKIIEKKFLVEGDLRRNIAENMKRLIETRSYRGIRHTKKLPVRGQRTRSNARTKRGKRMTVGALKKDDRAKATDSQTESKE